MPISGSQNRRVFYSSEHRKGALKAAALGGNVPALGKELLWQDASVCSFKFNNYRQS